MKTVLLNPMTGIPKSANSHVRGYENIWSKLLNAKILTSSYTYEDLVKESPEKIVITFGVNYKRNFGIIGGLADNIASRIIALVKYVDENPNTKLVVNFDKPDEIKYENFTCRVGLPSTSKMFTQDICDKFIALLKSSKYESMADFDKETIAVGDSHTPAFSNVNSCVYHYNGKTLFGILKMGLHEFIKPHLTSNTKLVEISAGSTDIRHHVLRDDNMYKTAEEFVLAYKKQVEEAEQKFGITINVCTPVPVEWEGRTIPQSINFKGTPFFGTEFERREYTKQFIDAMYKHFDSNKIVSCPKEWYTMDPEQFAKNHMERPRSVHLSPEHYRPTWS